MSTCMAANTTGTPFDDDDGDDGDDDDDEEAAAGRWVWHMSHCKCNGLLSNVQTGHAQFGARCVSMANSNRGLCSLEPQG